MSSAVAVAVRIRPQNAREKLAEEKICLAIIPGEPQITIGRDRAFTYDHVFADSSSQDEIYINCIHGLLEGTFDGYNATVLAYGQTGSGKTYTMGTCFDINQFQTANGTASTVGIIPRAANHLFSGIEERKVAARVAGAIEPTFEINVQFIELYNEEIVDLLSDDRAGMRNSTVIRIQEDHNRNEIYLRGATWRSAQDAQSIMNALKAGALNRTTAATNMNQQSSRSHAIFTVQVKQTRVVPVETAEDGSPQPCDGQKNEIEVLYAKFHFVDLAGSERLKRTGATGDRAKEGISINSGLLALGNVISALGGGSGGKVSHVPYRDSKLTRLLQDSLGGNSRTLMIACASPCDVDFIETLNTLNYANRAKNIKNKVVANQDKSSRLISDLRAQILFLESQLLEYRQGKRLMNEDGEESLNDQYTENRYLQNEVVHLQTRLKALGEANKILNSRITELQRDFELSKFRAASENKENGEGAGSNEESRFGELIQGYLQEIQSLRSNLIEIEATNEALRKQNHRYREQAGQIQHVSLQNSPFMPQQNVTSQNLINEAREEIERDKKALVSYQSEEKGPNLIPPLSAITEAVYDGEDEDVDNDDDEEDEEPDPLEQQSLERRDKIHSDLANLHEEISIKERLVMELETSQRRYENLRREFEKKMEELCNRIQSTEAERDKILNQMAAKKQTAKQKEEINKVREQYEKRLADMRLEHKRIELAERENKRMQAQQSRHQSDVLNMKRDVDNMKRQKVELMKRLKEENIRIREIQKANAQKVATFEKVQRQQQTRIVRLEREAVLKNENLRRKVEEVQRLKDQKKAMQVRRQTIYENKQSIKAELNERQQIEPSKYDVNATFNIETPSTVRQRGQQNIGENECYTPSNYHQKTPKLKPTPIRTKRQWNAIEKAIDSFTIKKTAITREEQSLGRLMAERRNLQDEFVALQSKYACTMDKEIRLALLEQQQGVQEKLQYVQEEILRSQMSIVELDDEQVKLEAVSRRTSVIAFPGADGSVPDIKDLDSLMFHFSREFSIPPDMHYILRNLIELTIQKGAEVTRLTTENKEMTALLQSNDDVREVIEAARVNAGHLEHDTTFLASNIDNLESGQKPSRLPPIFDTSYTQSAATSSTTQSDLVISSSGSATNVPIKNGEELLLSEGGQNPISSYSTAGTELLLESAAAVVGKRHNKRSPQFSSIEDVAGTHLNRIFRVYGHQKGVLCIHSNETKMISGSKDRSAIVWDLATGANLCTLGNHPNIVYSVVLLSASHNLALSSSLNIVKIWDLRAPPEERCVRHLSSMGLISQGENGHCERVRELPPTESDVHQMAVDPQSGRFLFTTSSAGVRIWDLDRLEHFGMIRDMSNSGDVRMLAVSDGLNNNDLSVRIATATKKMATLYEEVKIQKPVAPPQWVRLEPGHTKTLTSLCATRNALFTASKDQSIMRYSLLDSKRDHVESNAHSDVITVLYSLPQYLPRQQWIASGCRNGTLKLWDVGSSSRVHLLETRENAHVGALSAISASAGQLLYSASGDDPDSAVTIWRVSTDN